MSLQLGSHMTSRIRQSEEDPGTKLDFIDIRKMLSRADARIYISIYIYIYIYVYICIYVELPDEDAAEGRCGKLRKSSSRTRGAAQIWMDACIMEGAGVKRFGASRRAVWPSHDMTTLGHAEQL